MANTVAILSYTNTFADWLVTTNALARENNDFAANNYVKPTGTLFLNEPTLGLQVANNAIIAGQLQVQGIGSSATIQNNLQVGGQVYFSNTTLGLTNSGQAIFNGQISANGSNTGLFVANNTVIVGKLNVGSSGTFGSNVSIGTSASVGSFLNVGANTNIGTNLTVGDIIYNGNKIYTSFIEANTSIFTPILNVSQDAFVDTLQAYTSVNTALITAQTILANNIQANTSSIINANITNANVTSANITSSNITNANVTNANIISANITSGNITNAQANNLIITNKLDTNAATVFANNIQANTSSIENAQANNLIITNRLDANGALVSYFNNITTLGQLTVGGNFVLSGTTVYSSNNFVLNSGSAVGIDSQYLVNRGTSGANASIYWEEIPKLWKILNVDNGIYYRILNDEYLSSSSFLNSTSNVATSAAVFSANTFLQANTGAALASARSYTDTSNTSMKSYVDTANTSMKTYVDIRNDILSTRSNGLVQTAFVTVTANGATLTSTSNTDTLTITSATANGINVLNPATKTIDIGLRNSGVTPTTYGNTTSIPSITVDAFGRVTSASNTSITIPPSTSIVANSGQLTANATTGIVAIGLANTGVIAGIYGGSTQIPSFNVDSTGRITSSSNTSITIPPSTSVFANSGQLTANTNTGIVALGLADTTVVAGSYGSSTQIPSFNVDSKGRLTSVSNNTISVATASGYLASAIIFANTNGFLSNTNGLQYLTSNNTIIAPNIVVSGTISTPRFRAYTEAVNVVTSITSATYNIDLSQGNIFDLTANANITFTFTNPPAAGAMMTSTVIVRQDSVGSRLCTFTNSRYTDSDVPALTTLPNKADVLTFFTVSGGTIYFGSLAMANVALT